MKNLTKILIILLLFVIMSCTEDPDPDENMIFPLKVGNRREYLREFYLFNFDPDSLSEGLTDTTYTNITQEIVRTEMLFDTLETYVINTIENVNKSEFEDYYGNEDDGFYRYGYHNFGFKKNGNFKIKFKGRIFNNIEEALSFLKGISNYQVCDRDTTIYDDLPFKIFQSPLKIGSEWTNYIIDGNINSKREVISREIIETEAGLFDCYEVQQLIDLDEDGFWDEDISCFFYICSEGIIKTIAFSENMEFIGNQGEHLGYFNMYEETNLTEYTLF